MQVAHPEFRQSGWGVKADYLEIPLGYASDTKWDAMSKTATACSAHGLAETSRGLTWLIGRGEAEEG